MSERYLQCLKEVPDVLSEHIQQSVETFHQNLTYVLDATHAVTRNVVFCCCFLTQHAKLFVLISPYFNWNFRVMFCGT